MQPPPKQTNYQIAVDKGFEAVRERNPGELRELGALPAGEGLWNLAVLEDVFRIDLKRGTIEKPASNGGEENDAAEREPVPIRWQILALHYLAARTGVLEPGGWISFAELPDARIYDTVYRGRVIGRFCATAGRERGRFVRAARRLGGSPLPAGDEAFQFQAFPRLAVRIVWYAADEDFPPGASFTYPDNVLSYLPVEDVVVLSESMVGLMG